MDQIFYSELKEKCFEISDVNHDRQGEIEEVISAYDKIIYLSNIARKEGLLALEEAADEIEMTSETESFLFLMVMLVVDGTDPKFVYEAGMNRYMSYGMESYDALIMLLYLRGVLLIQEGCNPRVIETIIRTMMPPCILNALEKRECQNALPKALAEVEEQEASIKLYCDEEDVINEHDHSLVGQLSLALVNSDDRDVQRILRDIDIKDASLAMKGMKGQARKRIFDNISTRLGVMVAEDMDFMGPVRMRDVEESAAKITRMYVKLADRAEIEGNMASEAKLVLDMYTTAEKNNHEMREKFRDIKDMIDQIYKS